MANSVKNIARQLRLTQTTAEKLFWDAVRNRKVNGLKVRRQYPVTFQDNDGQDRCFIADFYCPRCKLIIEIDGNIHDDRQEYDNLRSDILDNLGFRVIRYDNNAVEKNLAKVISHFKEITAVFLAET